VSTGESRTETIVAIATAAGAGGIGIVRLSGPEARTIAETICGRRLRARHAQHLRFRDADGTDIDDGIALYFPAPHSYTGEDVVELQAHGSPIVLQSCSNDACGSARAPRDRANSPNAPTATTGSISRKPKPSPT
jgi:tRNA modification GTPase